MGKCEADPVDQDRSADAIKSIDPEVQVGGGRWEGGGRRRVDFMVAIGIGTNETADGSVSSPGDEGHRPGRSHPSR